MELEELVGLLSLMFVSVLFSAIGVSQAAWILGNTLWLGMMCKNRG